MLAGERLSDEESTSVQRFVRSYSYLCMSYIQMNGFPINFQTDNRTPNKNADNHTLERLKAPLLFIRQQNECKFFLYQFPSSHPLPFLISPFRSTSNRIPLIHSLVAAQYFCIKSNKEISMSIQKQQQIYTYALSVLSLQLKVKFPCKIYLQHSGSTITTEVASSSPNKFVFNQEITIKNDTGKEYIEVIVNLVTDKGAKYVGGVLKFVENELIGSQGERIVVPISKCLDTEAFCEIRVDQVSTSRVVKKVSPKKRTMILKSQYQPDNNLGTWNSQKNKISNQGQTKSQFNFPLTINRSKAEQRKEPTIGPSAMKKNFNRANEIDKEPTASMAGVSGVEFQVYKEGYNKLKEKYRKEAETARSELNKRMALESNENNMKLELMRFKLKTQELQKSVLDKNMKIKELTEAISNYQKKELDAKYLKEEVENKVYTIRNLEETIKTLTRDNAELKNIQSQRAQTEQDTIRSLKDEVEKLKREMENRQSELAREIRSKNDAITKKEYQLHTKSQELERAKCSIEDLEKAMSNKTFQWEKIQQSERSAAKVRLQEQKDKINKVLAEKSGVQQKLKNTEQLLQEKRGELVKIEYDKKVALQNNETLQRQNEELRTIRERYVELVREHKLVGEEKNLTEKNKERQIRQRDTQFQDLTQRFNALTESSKKTIKETEEKLKATQLKLVENQSQNELYKNQLEKAKRQNETLIKEIAELKNQIKDLRVSVKEKEEKYLTLINQLTDYKNRSKQGDYSTKLQVQRLKQEGEKLTKSLEEERAKSKQYYESINKLQLDANKNKMEWQFREERALKELSYAKEKINSLETFKQDLESQMASANQNITNLKASEKGLNEKIQRMQLEAIKARELFEKSKKEQKILEEKLQNNDNTIKTKIKDITEYQEARDNSEKRVTELQAEISQLKNDLNKEINEKTRNQKIVEILQGDLAKAKEEQTRLNTVIASREKVEDELREQIKKQKEQSTKLEMKLSALKKETDKFKETLVDNLQNVFSALPDSSGATSSPVRSSKSIPTPEKSTKENSEILNLLTSLGKDARNNMVKLVDQLKIAQRDHEKLNSEFSTTVNKCNTTEFEYSQTISRLEEEISEALADKQNIQNKYEEEVFLLEGRVKEKEEIINEYTEQLEELDFTYKNTRAELQSFREDTAKKDASRNKLIAELRQQIQYHLTSISLLQNNLEKHQEELEVTQIELDERNERIIRMEKEIFEIKEINQELNEEISVLKRQLKKNNERYEEVNLELLTEKQEAEKLRQNVQEEQRKSGQLRQFLNGLMKQKEEIIKKQLEKSEQILEFQTKLQELKHENEWNAEQIKKYKKLEEEYKETIKKGVKALKDEENAKNEEKNKNSKLSDKLKDKEKEIASKDETIAKLEEKLKKEKEKLGKDIRELQTQIDETYEKLLTKEKESNERILVLENQNEKQKMELEKLRELNINDQEALFSVKNKLEEKEGQLADVEKQLAEATEKIRGLEDKIKEFQEEFNVREEENFKLQGKIFSLQGKLEMKESEKNDKLENLHGDWQSKYDSMCEEYEQRLQLGEKEKEFLKERFEEKEKEVKKLVNELKLQENNISIIKKSFEDKIKVMEDDRLIVLSQKNTENQRLVEENRMNFDSLKAKQSQTRKLTGELELAKASITKLEGKLKENEQKIKSLNRTYLSQVQELKKKEQTFKRIKENVASSIWKSQRQVRRVVQNGIKRILEVVDEQSTMKVIEVTKPLEQNIVSAISIKLEEKEQ